MSEETKGPLLNLDTLIVRPQVIIDGQSYEMVSPDEMTIVERQRQVARGRRMQELLDKRELSNQEQGELARVLDEGCRAILLAPDDVHAKLMDGHRLDIIDAFGQLLLGRRRTAGEKPASPATDG